MSLSCATPGRPSRTIGCIIAVRPSLPVALLEQSVVSSLSVRHSWSPFSNNRLCHRCPSVTPGRPSRTIGCIIAVRPSLPVALLEQSVVSSLSVRHSWSPFSNNRLCHRCPSATPGRPSRTIGCVIAVRPSLPVALLEQSVVSSLSVRHSRSPFSNNRLCHRCPSVTPGRPSRTIGCVIAVRPSLLDALLEQSVVSSLSVRHSRSPFSNNRLYHRCPSVTPGRPSRTIGCIIAVRPSLPVALLEQSVVSSLSVRHSRSPFSNNRLCHRCPSVTPGRPSRTIGCVIAVRPSLLDALLEQSVVSSLSVRHSRSPFSNNRLYHRCPSVTPGRPSRTIGCIIAVRPSLPVALLEQSVVSSLSVRHSRSPFSNNRLYHRCPSVTPGRPSRTIGCIIAVRPSLPVALLEQSVVSSLSVRHSRSPFSNNRLCHRCPSVTPGRPSRTIGCVIAVRPSLPVALLEQSVVSSLSVRHSRSPFSNNRLYHRCPSVTPGRPSRTIGCIIAVRPSLPVALLEQSVVSSLSVRHSRSPFSNNRLCHRCPSVTPGRPSRTIGCVIAVRPSLLDALLEQSVVSSLSVRHSRLPFSNNRLYHRCPSVTPGRPSRTIGCVIAVRPSLPVALLEQSVVSSLSVRHSRSPFSNNRLCHRCPSVTPLNSVGRPTAYFLKLDRHEPGKSQVI